MNQDQTIAQIAAEYVETPIHAAEDKLLEAIRAAAACHYEADNWPTRQAKATAIRADKQVAKLSDELANLKAVQADMTAKAARLAEADALEPTDADIAARAKYDEDMAARADAEAEDIAAEYADMAAQAARFEELLGKR